MEWLEWKYDCNFVTRIKKDEIAIAEKELRAIKKKKNIHSTRYTGKSVEHRIRVWSWKGGKPIKTSLLSSTIYNVMERLSICPTSKEIHDIVLETAAVESLLDKSVDLHLASIKWNQKQEKIF